MAFEPGYNTSDAPKVTKVCNKWRMRMLTKHLQHFKKTEEHIVSQHSTHDHDTARKNEEAERTEW